MAHFSLTELQAVQDATRAWRTWKGRALPKTDARSIDVALVSLDQVGLPTLMSRYDANRDGEVSQKELLADIRLDSRPLGAILGDPRAVNYDAIGRRFGGLGVAAVTLVGRPGGAR